MDAHHDDRADGSPPAAPLRVAIANDDPIIIEGLRALLSNYDRITVVGVAQGDPEIVVTPDALPEADVLLLDTFGRGAGGIDAARMLLSQDPPFRVVVFTDSDDERLLLQALRLGVAGYLTKSANADELVADLERVADGETVIDRRLATNAALLAARSIEVGTWPGAHLGLTKREAEVLALVARGLSPADVEEKLGVAHETIRSHLRQIYRKLDVSDRAAAVAVAWREGVVS